MPPSAVVLHNIFIASILANAFHPQLPANVRKRRTSHSDRNGGGGHPSAKRSKMAYGQTPSQTHVQASNGSGGQGAPPKGEGERRGGGALTGQGSN